MRARSQGLIAINLAAVLFGTAALYGKLPLSPVWIVAVRAIFAAGALLLLTMLSGAWTLDLRHEAKALFKSGAALCAHWVTFFLSVQEAGVAIATLTFACYPLFTVLLESWERRRVPTPRETIAGTGILVAVFLLVDPREASEGLLPGTLVGILSALLFAWFGVASKDMAGRLSPLTVSLVQNGVVLLLLLPFLPFTGPAPSALIHWFWLLTLGIVTTALMHQLYLYALKRLPASTCSAFVALEPVYAILFAALMFGEPITFKIVISGILILAAAFTLLKREPAPQRRD